MTGNSISLSPRWRQRGSRYAIRAGRNLPDNEFRYLRTVIVTAAVYRGFNSALAHLLLTFRHRAGVRPYTSPCGLAEPCVFSKQSPPPGLCPRPTGIHLRAGPPSRELTEAFCRVPSTWFSQAPWYTLPVHLCRFGVRSHGGLFPGTAQKPGQSDKAGQSSRSVTSSRPRNINLVPIDYAFRPRLRGRLTLLRLALSRKPWTFGDRISHPVCRYSCHHIRFCSLHRRPRGPASQREPRSDRSPSGIPVPSQNAPLPPLSRPEASARGLSPVTSSPQDNLPRPVSCYAFFKGWLLLSQPPGCFGRPTCFPT